MAQDVSLDCIVALCKRRGFVYPSAEIYGGLNGVYEFGPLGTMLRSNIRNAWHHSIAKHGETMVPFEGAILGSEALWEASGHLAHFSDPMIDCTQCKKRFRADDINRKKSCPNCGKKAWTEIRQFQLMFKSDLGAVTEQATTAYLRPETAQSIFVNFKNIMSTTRVKIPFGITQVGKAFRNEITPKQFLFRMREFEQMELEFFCKEQQAQTFFDEWVTRRETFYHEIGITAGKLQLRKHGKEELAHYSLATTDIEYAFPFGWKELEGIAYRGDYDLRQHSIRSGKDLSVFDEENKKSYLPHVIECSVGVDRLFLSILCDAYREDVIEGEERTVLKLHPSIAPIKAAILPLTKKLVPQTEKLFQDLTQHGYPVQFDATGSIGKRYRRQDEIGTPVCFTYDFDSEQDHKVTARDRDSLKQERIALDQVADYLKKIIAA